MTEELIGQLGYVGIALILVLGGLGLPVPEEAPIILAAMLSRTGKMRWELALTACFVGVLLGDFIVYFIGYFYGEKVLSLPLTRKFLTREREVQIKGYFHRHGFKILILGRFAVGFRTAAYLTAGILQLPILKLFLTDLLAATLSTTLMFGLGYIFAHQIQTSFDQAKHWMTAIVGITVALWLLHRYYKGWRRAGLPVGPPVLVSDDIPLPPTTCTPLPPGRSSPTSRISRFLRALVVPELAETLVADVEPSRPRIPIQSCPPRPSSSQIDPADLEASNPALPSPLHD